MTGQAFGVGGNAQNVTTDSPPQKKNSSMTKQIEWVHEELVNWGEWSRRDTLTVGKYKCPLAHLIKRRAEELREVTTASNQDGTPNENRAMRVDSALAQVAPILQSVAKLKYIAEVTNQIGSQRLKVSEPTFKRWVCKLHEQLSPKIPRCG